MTAAARSATGPNARWGLVAAGWSVYAVYYLGRVNFSAAAPRLGEEAGLEAAEIGALAAGFFWVYSLSAVPIGRLADRIGARRLVGLGLVGSGVMNVLFVVSSGSFVPALIVWSANGLFQAMGWTPLVGALGRWVPEERAGRVMASFGSCFAAGSALTFALGGFIVERGGAAAVFIAAAAVLVPVGVVWWIGVRDPIAEPPDSERPRGAAGRLLGLLPPAAAIGAAYVALLVWTPSYFVEVHGVSVARSGLLSAAMPAIAVAATIALGRWFRISAGPRPALKGGIVLTAAAAALITINQVSSLAGGFAAVAAATALVGASSSLVLGLFPRMVNPAGAGFAGGVFILAFNLGGGAGSPLVGGFVGRGAWDAVFLFLAGTVLAGAVWTYGWYARARSIQETGGRYR